MRTTALAFLFGLLSGALGGLMGVGGGILLVPLLVHAVHTRQHEAQGTSLVFVTAAALVATIPYIRQGNIDFGLALILMAGAVPGVLVGAAVARRMTARGLRRAFGLMIFVTAIRILAAAPNLSEGTVHLWRPPFEALLGFGVGFLGGLLGIGGGTMLVPVLVLTQHVPQHLAQGVSLLMIVPTGVVGGWSHARHGHVVRSLLPGLIAGGVLGALAGALLAHRIGSTELSRLFALFLIPVSLQMIFGRGRATVADPATTPES